MSEHETGMKTVKEMMETYSIFESRLEIMGFNILIDRNQIGESKTEICLYDVNAQIDGKDETRKIVIDTFKLWITKNGERIKSFVEPIRPRIDYSLEMDMDIDREKEHISFNLKSLRVYADYSPDWMKGHGIDHMSNVILTDGEQYVWFKVNSLDWDDRKAILGYLTIIFENNYFASGSYAEKVRQDEVRKNRYNSGGAGLFSMGRTNGSLNAPRKIEDGYKELDNLIGLDIIK